MAFGRRRSSQITMSSLADYRTTDDVPFDGRVVDVDEASRRLGVSKKAVREVIANAKSAFSDKVFRRFTGRAEADRSQSASPRGMLQAAFGGGPRGGAVNAKEAAAALGVSPGTVRRWAAGTQQPSSSRLAALRTAARRVTSTKRGRKAATDAFRKSAAGKAALQRGTKIWVYGYQGPPAPKDKDYARDRTIYHHIDTTDVEAMLRAYEEGGDDGFRDWLNNMGRDYMRGDPWEFTDIYDLGFDERP